FQMELEFYDGTKQTIVSDESWQARLSPIVSNTLYDGEVYDARLEYNNNWVKASLLDGETNATTLFSDRPEVNKAEEAGTFTTSDLRLIASPSPPVRVTQELQRWPSPSPGKAAMCWISAKTWWGTCI
ncbi:MAG: alpha-L-rhamnosidase N-terminal domain-containing protein, partial [Leadbetterella sp.]|nr:alpha-L-rhamnosidase N-terminal domain-containing protein [Leadbetterella sp.]